MSTEQFNRYPKPYSIRAEQNDHTDHQRDLPIDSGGEHLGRVTLRLRAADVLRSALHLL